MTISRPDCSRPTPSPAAARSSARTTPSHCSRPSSSAGSCGRWVIISRPGSSRTTPSPAAAASSARARSSHCAAASLLGLVLWSLGEYQRARQLQGDALTRSRRVLGEDQPETLRAASPFGLTLDRWASTSRPVASRATPSPAAGGCWVRTTLKPSPRPAGWPLTCIRWANSSRPVSLQSDTLTRSRRVLGEDHPETLTSASRLASALHSLGEFSRPVAPERHSHPQPACAG